MSSPIPRGVLLSLFGSMAKSLEASLSGGAKPSAEGEQAPRAQVPPPWHVEEAFKEKEPVLKQQVA